MLDQAKYNELSALLPWHESMARSLYLIDLKNFFWKLISAYAQS